MRRECSLTCLVLCASFVVLHPSDPLAYYAAKANGLDEVAEEILDAAGMTEEDVPALASGSSGARLAPPPIVTSTASSNWPVKPIGDNFFAKALLNGHDAPRANGDVADEGAAELSSWGNENPLHASLDDGHGDGGQDEDGEEEAEGWDLDAEVPEEAHEEEQNHEDENAAPEDAMSPGISEHEIWVRNSPLAADHIAAGSFETAMQVRNSETSLHPLTGIAFGHTLLSLKCHKLTVAAFVPFLSVLASQPATRHHQLCPPQASLPLSVPILASIHPGEPFASATPSLCPSKPALNQYGRFPSGLGRLPPPIDRSRRAWRGLCRCSQGQICRRARHVQEHLEGVLGRCCPDGQGGRRGALLLTQTLLVCLVFALARLTILMVSFRPVSVLYISRSRRLSLPAENTSSV